MDHQEEKARAEVYQRSRRRWERVRRQAEERWPGTDMPDSLFDIDSLLHRIPALPSQIPMGDSITGFATWKNMDPGCSLREKQDEDEHVVLRHGGTRCRRSTSGAFDRWSECRNNGLTLLILGWAYVLNASLVERQGQQLSLMIVPRYASKMGTAPPQERGPPLSIQLQSASADERAWWASLVRRGGVYKVAADKGCQSYLPWSLIVEEDWNVQIVDAAPIPKTYPTAEQAARYIHRFATTFGLGNQNAAALCAALTIPFHIKHNFRDCVVELPPLSLESPSLPSAEEAILVCDTSLKLQRLSYLMTLSMALHVVDGVLQSVFWEPHVPSRFAGASMLGMRHALAPLVEGRDHMTLAKVFSFTDAGPLWLGSLLCGRSELMSLVLDKFGTGARHVPHVTAWTGVIWSFLQVRPRGPAVTAADDDDQSCLRASRADVWRLRQECSDAYEGDEAGRYGHGPSHGWEPDGEMRLKDVDLELRGHMRCHHLWNYRHWTWRCGGAVDPGFRPTSKASHWLQREDPGSAQPTTTEMDDLATLTDDDERIMDLFSDTARCRLAYWCPDQMEGDWLADLAARGIFKKPDFGEPPEESAPLELSPGKRKFVLKWRDEVISSEPSDC